VGLTKKLLIMAKITTTVNKSAKDGRFVSNTDVKNKPSTTYVQTVEKTVLKKK
jgi:hypothetical protein